MIQSESSKDMKNFQKDITQVLTDDIAFSIFEEKTCTQSYIPLPLYPAL